MEKVYYRWLTKFGDKQNPSYIEKSDLVKYYERVIKEAIKERDATVDQKKKNKEEEKRNADNR